VALNLLFLGERAGGVGRYARELPGGLLEADPRTEIHVLASRSAPTDLRSEPWADDVRWIHLPVRNAGLPLVAAQYIGSPLLAALKRLDVLHSPANTGAVITPGLASVVSLMDVIWLVRPKEWEQDRAAQRATLRQVKHAVRRAHRVFTISEAAAADISTALGVERARLTVTPLGARPPMRSDPAEIEGVRARLQLGDARVVLCVSQKRPYKNLHTLVRALPELPDDVLLVIPGSWSPYEDELRTLAETLGVAERLRLPDWVSDEELEALYRTASAFALPSLIEGFGLPLIEAMARGVPVACSNRSALAEVAGDAALQFDPTRQEEITLAVRRLLDDRALSQRLAERGRVRAAEFTWRKTGEASLAGYRAAIASRGRRAGAGTSARR
jgi:glycosyltransferase involved in cell wall biosynthesis